MGDFVTKLFLYHNIELEPIRQAPNKLLLLFVSLVIHEISIISPKIRLFA